MSIGQIIMVSVKGFLVVVMVVPCLIGLVYFNCNVDALRGGIEGKRKGSLVRGEKIGGIGEGGSGFGGGGGSGFGEGGGGGGGFGGGGGGGGGGGMGFGSGGGFGWSNSRLFAAYVALQSWKKAITDDPLGITKSWVGKDVCSYVGVFCAPPLDKSCDKVVAGIDLNHGLLQGYLVEELGLLTDIALFHLNSNRFSGSIPLAFKNLQLLSEVDVSNNWLSGFFPTVLLELQSLIYLDLRFNNFKGSLPPELFNKKLDAIFLNNNYFEFEIPANLGNSPASVISFANNKLSGGIPQSIGNMGETLNEVLFLNNQLSGCLPEETGMLAQVTVLDLSFTGLEGHLPLSLACLHSVEQFILAQNKFHGTILDGLCSLPSLINLRVSYNYFTGEGSTCPALPARGVVFDDSHNCIPGRGDQRATGECAAFGVSPKTCIEMPLPSHLLCTPPPPPRFSMPVPSFIYASPPPPPPHFSMPVPSFIYASPPPPPPSPPTPPPPQCSFTSPPH